MTFDTINDQINAVLQPKPEAAPKKPKSVIADHAPVGPRLGRGEVVKLKPDIVGSVHDQPVLAPFNMDTNGAAAQMTATIQGTYLSMEPQTIHVPSLFDENAQGVAKFQVKYAPKRAGDTVGEMNVTARWKDGHVETTTLQVFANATKLESEETKEDASAPQHSNATQPRAAADQEATYDRFETLSQRLEAHLGDLRDEQVAGVDAIEKEAAEFKEEPDEGLLAILGDVAVMMATAGFASLAGKLVSKAINKWMGANATNVAHAAADAVASHGEHAAEKVVEHGAAHAAHEEAKHASIGHLVVEGVGDVVEEGLKGSVEKARRTLGQGAGHEGKPGAEHKFSEHARIHYFASQQKLIRTAHASKRDSMQDVASGLRPLARENPAQAIAAIEATLDGIDVAASRAADLQQIETAKGWVRSVAQSKLGTRGDEAHPTTNLASLRVSKDAAGLTLVPNAADGVLEIEAPLDELGVANVVRARLDGVSRLIGDRLLAVDLKTAGLPVRIRIGQADVITVDEAGTVRVSGTMQLAPDTPGDASEAQKFRAARAIVDHIFSRSLSGWGIKQIRSNDGSK